MAQKALRRLILKIDKLTRITPLSRHNFSRRVKLDKQKVSQLYHMYRAAWV